MSAFHMDIAGTADRFERIDRTGKSCAIRNNGSYMKVPCAWCGRPYKASADNCLTDQRYAELKEKLNGEHNLNDKLNMLPTYLAGYINKFVFNTDPLKEKYWKWVHAECVEFPTTTNSGRKVKSVKRFADQSLSRVLVYLDVTNMIGDLMVTLRIQTMSVMGEMISVA